MWLLWALGGVTCLAAEGEVEVEVRGVGSVPLSEASATCLEGRAKGSLDEPKPARVPAFREVARGLLGLTPDERRAWMIDGGDLWPTIPADVDYPPEVPMAAPWVAQACLAVGRHWVDVGLALSTTCAEGKKQCRAAFTEDELEIVKEAQKAAKKSDGGTDAFFDVVRGFDEALVTWRDPQPYLARACDWPAAAANGGRFVDTDDLVASRRACLQQLALIRRGLGDTLDALTCDTPWRGTTADQPHLAISATTDLGLGGAQPDVRADGILDKLRRMDPSPAACDAGWASVWRTSLPARWREAQSERACVDPALTMTDRKRLCPDLVGVLRSRCGRDDGPACHTLSRMTLVGLGVPMDERAGIEMLAQACNASYEPSCRDVTGFAPMVSSWHQQLLVAPEEGDEPDSVRDQRLADAEGLVLRYQRGLGEAWTLEQVMALFDAAAEADADELAARLLEQYAAKLDEDWVKKAERKLR